MVEEIFFMDFPLIFLLSKVPAESLPLPFHCQCKLVYLVVMLKLKWKPERNEQLD